MILHFNELVVVFSTRNLMFLRLIYLQVQFPPTRMLSVVEMFDTKTEKLRPDVLKHNFILDGRIEEAAALCPLTRTLLHSARKTQKK